MLLVLQGKDSRFQLSDLLPGLSQACLSALDFSLQPLILLPEQLVLLLRQLAQFIPVQLPVLVLQP